MTTPQTNTKRLAAVTGLSLVAVIGVGSIVGSDSRTEAAAVAAGFGKPRNA